MRNVLAVDDDKDILYTLEAISEAADFNIVTTTNGKDLLDIINLDNFSLIILDYYMPNINGLDLLKKIRKIQSDSIKHSSIFNKMLGEVEKDE